MLELYRSEFKTLQSDLLNISIDLQQPMRFDLIVYHTYYDFFICKKIPPGVKDIERIEQDYKYWVHSFLKNYGKENKSLLYSEILKLDIAKLEQVKPFWNGNLEDYISYPNFNKLIDCLKKIKYFHVFYESYNRMLDTTHVNPIETKEHSNKHSDFYNCLLYTSDAADEEDSVDIG